MPEADQENLSIDGVDRVIEQIERSFGPGRDLAVILIFVDNVDRVCATSGHVHADVALNDFHLRLGEFSQEGHSVVRLSDRKFVLVLKGFRNAGHVRLAAQKVQRLIHKSSKSILNEDKALMVRMGVVIQGRENFDAHRVLRCVEIALIDGGTDKEDVTFYREDAADQFIASWNLEQKLSDALESGELELYYQPQMDIETRRIVGAEALIRWHDPVLGEVPPDVFIDVAEKSGLITDLTYFSIQRAFRQLHEWRESAADMTVAVNTTPSAIRDSEIIDVLKIAASIWDIELKAIVLEVTENALMVDPKASHRILTGIRKLGAGVSIDDFGTGYSSLAYLKELPADELKIDRSFILSMLSSRKDYKIVEHAVSLAKSFGLRTVAEGVVNDEMLNVLWTLGCDIAQGYYICEPLPADDFLRWYLERKSA
ncbi:MAG: GGDEF domain-containing phosphodiesterase [Gammaproteobacteria bacterium]|nr:GGDEF domain-containing phosphodiesterase [Gammaproteobacteria bacterium]